MLHQPLQHTTISPLQECTHKARRKSLKLISLHCCNSNCGSVFRWTLRRSYILVSGSWDSVCRMFWKWKWVFISWRQTLSADVTLNFLNLLWVQWSSEKRTCKRNLGLQENLVIADHNIELFLFFSDAHKILPVKSHLIRPGYRPLNVAQMANVTNSTISTICQQKGSPISNQISNCKKCTLHTKDS